MCVKDGELHGNGESGELARQERSQAEVTARGAISGRCRASEGVRKARERRAARWSLVKCRHGDCDDIHSQLSGILECLESERRVYSRVLLRRFKSSFCNILNVSSSSTSRLAGMKLSTDRVSNSQWSRFASGQIQPQ
jgi:hypothetical protein